eukprot:EG_transcript_9797
MAHRVSIKAHLCSHGKDEFRRFALPANPTWEACLELLKTRFGQREVTVLYVDSEGDEVTVRGEADWQECLRLLDGPLLRLLLRPRLPRKAKAALPEPGPAPEAKLEVPLSPALPAAPPQAAGGEAEGSGRPEDSPPLVAEPSPVPAPVPKTAQQLGDEALRLLDGGEYSEALQLLRQACALEVLPHNVYNMACCHALLKQKAQALACLREAVFRGYRKLGHIQRDPDLKSLRGEPQFLAVLQSLRDAPEDSDPSAVVSLPSSALASLPDTEAPSSPTSSTASAPPFPSPVNLDAVFREARQHARAGRRFQALKALRTCLAAGQLQVSALDDPDFDRLVGERQFDEIRKLAAALC